MSDTLDLPPGGLPHTRAELLVRVRAARARLEAAVAALDPAALTRPGDDGWSIQDHLYHLSAWLRETLACLRGEPGHAALGVSPALYEAGGDEAINAELQRRSARLALDDVLDGWRASHAAALARVEALPDGPLEAALSLADLDALVSATCDHDDDHRRWIEPLARLHDPNEATMNGTPYPTDTKPVTKTDLLARIRSARAALELKLAPLDEAALTEPGPDGWAIRDHLFHLSAWLRKTSAVLHGRPGHEALGVPLALYASGDEDAINDRLFQQSRLLLLSDVQKVFRASHLEMLDYLEAQPEERLTAPYNPADPQDDRRVLDAVASNTYEHDEEHLGWLERRLAG